MITKQIVVLVGVTGDLAKRKLLPAIAQLKEKGQLPADFRLIGVSRKAGVEIDGVDMLQMDLDNSADYQKLKAHLEDIKKEWGQAAQRLFYLSVAPTVSMHIIEQLGKAGLSTGDAKLLLEKPFGTDIKNAEELIKNIEHYFTDEQVYRVDHYLQKDSVRALQNQKLDLENVKEIQIYAREKIGIEGRGDFYEQTGALRDFVQSHLLEVATMVIDPTDRLSVLKNLSVPSPLSQNLQRAQYKGYREDVEKPDSIVETFVSVPLQFQDLVVVLKTGKALDQKSTDVTIFYKDGATKVISLNDPANAYEHVFADAIHSDKQFFVSKEEMMENWRIITPIQAAWAKSGDDLTFYEQGSVL